MPDRLLCRAGLLAGLLLFAGPLAATSLSACRALRADAERLACYDALADAARRAEAAAARVDDVYRSEPAAAAQADSLLDGRWELDADSKLGPFTLRAHKPVYVLPAFWSSAPNQLPTSPNPRNRVTEPLGLRSLENKFQLSFKTKVWEGVLGEQGDLWFGYTQSSRWQLYDDAQSRPFRETNYEPQIDLVFGLDQRLAGDWRARLLGVGLLHQSNGRSLPLSRSWDRAVLSLGVERPGWALLVRPWWRLPESAADDDNRDIEDYLGRADLQLVHQRGGHEFAWLLRHSLRGGAHSRGALQFDWSFPLHRQLRGHLQLFEGYGESLIDYNHRASYVGIGVSLLPWY
jgi:phospholipase A1/A2